ncbi:MAG: MBL fold metallo-hydrolase [Thermoleophilaceae bacterium]|nr:MBL fold metallo-hydrolase [Thermoleophilaceae bacterium]
MPDSRKKRIVARADKVLPGVWRLRLPISIWPGVPHVNAWAVSSGNGVVLFDTGLGEPGGFAQLELALRQAGLSVDHIRLVVCTHAHSDHYGLAAPIVERTGCELWMHPNHDHMLRNAGDPAGWLERRLEVARQSGVPPESLEAYREARKDAETGVAGIVHPDRELVPGVEVETDLGVWQVHETPGHAPSHVVLHQPERRLLITGDHLLGRISLYYDFGYTPDPGGEFLRSLDVVEGLDADLCLPGHGRPFRGVPAKAQAYRELVLERVAKVRESLVAGPLTPYEVVPCLLGPDPSELARNWAMGEVLVYLRHLEVEGEIEEVGGEPTRFRLAQERGAAA